MEIRPTPFKSPNDVGCRNVVSALPNPLSNTPHRDVCGRQGEVDDLNAVTNVFPTPPSRKKAEAAECALDGEIGAARDKAVDFS